MRVPLVSLKTDNSGVLEVVEEEKKEKKTKAAWYSKEYETKRMRKFSAKWQVGRPWLQHDQDKGMIWGRGKLLSE